MAGGNLGKTSICEKKNHFQNVLELPALLPELERQEQVLNRPYSPSVLHMRHTGQRKTTGFGVGQNQIDNSASDLPCCVI